MPVRMRNGVWYTDFRYRDPQTGRSTRFKRTTGAGTTKREAEALERQWRQELETPDPVALGRDGKPSKMAAFSGFAKRWYDKHLVPNRKASYLRSSEQILRVHLVPFFGDRDLRDIEVEDLEDYIAEKAEDLSPKTVNNHLGLLSSLMTNAVSLGYTDRNPVQDVEMLKLPPQEFRFWDAEQTDLFLRIARVDEPAWHPFFLCALRTGMRLGELFGLRWVDVDDERHQVHVIWSWSAGKMDTPKSGKRRSIPMTPDLERVLLASRHLKGPLVFCQPDGQPFNRNFVKGPFERITRRAGLPVIRLHDLRHSYASQLVMAGVPLAAVQEFLGHSDVRMTMRYAHLAPSVRQDYVLVLDPEHRRGRSHGLPLPGDRCA